MGVAEAHPISPELVLVCPELRQHALTLLPALDPDELFVVPPAPARAQERPRLVLAEQPAPLPVAIAVYLSEALVLGVLRAAALTAVIAVAAFALSW